MNIVQTIIDFVGGKETDLTREEAESAIKAQDDRTYENFRKDLNKLIKQSCHYKTSLWTELTSDIIKERREQLAKEYESLGFDVTVVDDKILGEGINEAFLFISWGKKKP